MPPDAWRLPPRTLLELADPLALRPFAPTLAEPCALPVATVWPEEFFTVPEAWPETEVRLAFSETVLEPDALPPRRPVTTELPVVLVTPPDLEVDVVLDARCAKRADGVIRTAAAKIGRALGNLMLRRHRHSDVITVLRQCRPVSLPDQVKVTGLYFYLNQLVSDWNRACIAGSRRLKFMSSFDNQDQPNITRKNSGSRHAVVFAGLATGLVLALAGDAYLMVRSNDLNNQVTQAKQEAQSQIAKMSETTQTTLEQERQQLETLSEDVTGKVDTANSALRKARLDAQRASAQLSAKLEEQQKAVGQEIGELKDATTTATTKLNEDVTGVKTDVGAVRTDLSSTQSDLEKTGADLKRAMGDMGVMSGLIATNSKDLQALRDLGERNYIEFDLEKGATTKKVGNLTLTLKKADPKHNRYTIAVLADDKTVEKKDKTINEPVQLYTSGSKQPYEIVVNQVKKDGVVGYLAAPKVMSASR
jgi:hypothetical protein